MQKNSDYDLCKEEKFRWNFDTTYEFTLNLNDENQFPRKIASDLRSVSAHETVKAIFESFGTECKYYFRYELSHPQFGDNCKHRFARIHWHGLIRFTSASNLYHFLENGIQKLTYVGRFQANNYRPDIWEEYIRKDEHIFRKRFRIRNVHLTYFKKCIPITAKELHGEFEDREFKEPMNIIPETPLSISEQPLQFEMEIPQMESPIKPKAKPRKTRRNKA